MNTLLLATLLLPLLSSLTTLLPARHQPPRIGSLATGSTLLLSAALAAGFDYGDAGHLQAETNLSWIPTLGVRLHLGVDGISLPLLLLTALLTFLCAVHSERRPPPGGSPTARSGLLLLLDVGMLSTFAVQDLLLFFLAFEIVLIPMYFLINRWGSAGATAASQRFVLYTLLGSALMLLGLLLVGLNAGTFDMARLAARHGAGLSHHTQLLAALTIGLGLAVKAPMWPLHSWLPDAHTAAPTVGSVLLAGVLLKMGSYGMIRLVLPIVPHGAHILAPYLAAFGVVSLLYGSLVCLAMVRRRHGRDADLKRLIAYSSVGHMGFVLLGIATLTRTGVNGALFAGVAHGLITGLLFFLVGAVKERHGTASLGRIAGAAGGALYARAPRLGALLAFGAIASLGLPGLAGFWGEMLALFGAYQPGHGLSRSGYLTVMALGGLGTVLTAGYLLLMISRVCMGPYHAGSRHQPIPDLTRLEIGLFTPLVLLTLVTGLWPATLLALTNPAVTSLVGGR